MDWGSRELGERGKEQMAALDILILSTATALALSFDAQRFSRAFSEPSIVKTWPVYRSKDYSSVFVLTFHCY